MARKACARLNGMSGGVSLNRHIICHVAGGGDRGGAKTHILALLTHMDSTRFNCSLVCLNDGPLAEEARESGLDVTVIPMYHHLDVGAVFRLRKHFKRIRPVIVQTHGVRANLVGRIAAKMARVTHILSTMHSLVSLDYPTPFANSVFTYVDRLSSTLAERLIAVSGQLKENLIQQGFPKEKFTVIHNGIDLSPYQVDGDQVKRKAKAALGIHTSTRVIGTVGRLVPIKGYEDFLTAAGKIKSFEKDICFLMVGDGPCLEKLKEQAANLGISEQVIFTGYRADTADIFFAMDVFVITSLSEGLPIVMLEAMAAGLPIVATAVGGIPEVITHQKNGILVKPRQPNELADRIIALMEDPVKAIALSLAGKRTVRDGFSMDVPAALTADLYDELLNGNGDRNPAARRGRH